MSKRYWRWQAEMAYDYSVAYPDMRWEKVMYYYLFRWAGYEG